jgi:diguanylate cyclase (GGDEF)-like protein
MVRILLEPRVTALLLSIAAVAVAIARVAVLETRLRTLREQAVTDPLTGAFNRRQMYVALAAAVERRHRAGERASILLIDVDRFKEINDAFGHAEGDRALKALVTLIERRFRKLDFVFRAGGEEFVLLLASTRFADAFAVAEELRTLVIAAALVPDFPLSISVGVAEFAIGASVDAWLDEADAALYRAKRAGRNRVAGRCLGVRGESAPAASVHQPVRIS